jgi:hypothetical protein
MKARKNRHNSITSERYSDMRNTVSEVSANASSVATKTIAGHTNPYEQVQPTEDSGNSKQQSVVYPSEAQEAPPPYNATSQRLNEGSAASASKTSDQGKSQNLRTINQ